MIYFDTKNNRYIGEKKPTNMDGVVEVTDITRDLPWVELGDWNSPDLDNMTIHREIGEVSLPDYKARLQRELKDTAYVVITEVYPIWRQLNIQAKKTQSLIGSGFSQMRSFIDSVRSEENRVSGLINDATTHQEVFDAYETVTWP